MGVFNNWPYTDVHQLNLDWILKVVQETKEKEDLIDQSVEDAQGYAESAQQNAELAEGYKDDAKGYKDDAEGYKDGAEQYYNQTLSLVTGSPKVVTLAADMTDPDIIYVYVGSEAGYTAGNWYYYNGGSWVSGGAYGAMTGGISDNARNLLKYILDRAVYTEPDMEVYVTALYNELTQSGGGVLTTYIITNALSHVINSNSATGCNENDSYSATLTADAGYEMGTVVITMGGVDITSTAYDSQTGAITIAAVSGDLLITATAVLPSSVGYLEVGTPSITSNILTCSDGNFIKTLEPFSPADSSWKITSKYKKTTPGTSLSGYSDIFGSVDSNDASYRSVLYELNNTQGTHMGVFLSSNGTSWDIQGTATAIDVPDPEVWIWVEMSFDGANYYCKISTDGETWSTVYTKASTTAIIGGYPMAFGLKRNEYFKGDIDLTECKIWINDQLWWRAV